MELLDFPSSISGPIKKKKSRRPNGTLKDKRIKCLLPLLPSDQKTSLLPRGRGECVVSKKRTVKDLPRRFYSIHTRSAQNNLHNIHTNWKTTTLFKDLVDFDIVPTFFMVPFNEFLFFEFIRLNNMVVFNSYKKII